MRPTARFSLIFGMLMLVSGCQHFALDRLWWMNRGENYMNDDAQFCIPPVYPTSPSPATDAERPE